MKPRLAFLFIFACAWAASAGELEDAIATLCRPSAVERGAIDAVHAEKAKAKAAALAAGPKAVPVIIEALKAANVNWYELVEIGKATEKDMVPALVNAVKKVDAKDAYQFAQAQHCIFMLGCIGGKAGADALAGLLPAAPYRQQASICDMLGKCGPFASPHIQTLAVVAASPAGDSDSDRASVSRSAQQAIRTIQGRK
jgi:HEAT repeat protein